MGKKPETRFKERIRPLLDALPRSWWVKIQMLAFRGIPDFIGCINGHFVALELKVDDTADPLQGWVLSKIIRAGGLGLVVTPENWDATFKMLIDLAARRIIFQPEDPPPGEPEH